MSKQEKEGKIILNNEHRVCNATGLLIMLLMVSKLSIAAVVGCLTCLIKISACMVCSHTVRIGPASL